jgi:hypothetical protein
LPFHKEGFKKWEAREETMELTDAGLACYDNGRWLGELEGPYVPLVEVVDAMVIEQHIILAYPHPRGIQGIDIKVEGKVGRQLRKCCLCRSPCIDGLVPSLLILPLMHFLANILAPIFGM